MSKEKSFSTEWLGRTLTVKTGKLAKQADAAVVVQYGDTVVMTTVVQSPTERDGVNFFPLMVECEERLYAAGIIKGSRWVKREGRPSDSSILTGRMIDRTIRPLFDDSSRKDIQVINTILSVDQENDYDIVALVASSIAVSISGAKWNGPISGVRVARIENELVFNPTYEQMKSSDLDLIVAGTKEKTIMIEAAAQEIPEAEMEKALLAGQKELQAPIALIEKIKKEMGVKEKAEPQKLDSEDDKAKAEEKVRVLVLATEWLNQNIKKMLFDKAYHSKGERKAVVRAIKEGLDKHLFEQGLEKDQRSFAIKETAEGMIEAEVSRSIIEDKKRVDGRKMNEIRELIADTSLFPRTHGDGLFSRGETQVMSITTLGAPSLEQTLEDLEGETKKRYMHHYNFPPYSVNEAKPLRGTGRREVGHGALAEKALLPVLPSKEEFSYTIRVVSETLGSNGSSSMASTCGSSLSLMDAGVPIKTAVAGIAMGLASNEDMSKWQVLTDIQDLEDGKGGMDFKITGTKNGLTAVQLDTKTDGINEDIIKETLVEGRNALDQILKVMNKAISEPKEMSPYAPRIINLKINPEKIGMVIGPGGKVINKIIDETDVSIDIEEDGLVVICGQNADNCKKAEAMVAEIVHEFEAGEVIKGEVVRMLDFGAFVKLNANQDGLVHVSEMAPYRVGNPTDLLKIGDIVEVKVKEIDDQGRVSLTMKTQEANSKIWENEPGKSEGGFTPGNSSRDRNSGRSNDRRSGGGNSGFRKPSPRS